MGILNHHAVDNGNVEVYPLEYPFEYTSDSVTDTYTTQTKSMDNAEMDRLLKLFHTNHDNNILNVDLQMLQA